MTSIVVGDFETYYSKQSKYGLSSKVERVGLDGQSVARKTMMQEYLEDARFEVIMSAFYVAENNSMLQTIGSGDASAVASGVSDAIFVAHNAPFDAAILDQEYGIRPRQVFCTLAMAEALGLRKRMRSLSLASLAEFFGIGEKGREIASFDGKRLHHASLAEVRNYARYNRNDVYLTWKLFNILRAYLPLEEMLWCSLCTKMYSEPSTRLNSELLIEELKATRIRKQEAREAILEHSGCASIEALNTIFRSPKKFAALLEKFGVEPPTKTSKTTGKPAFAFSKKDQDFLDLRDMHDNPVVRQLCELKLDESSNQEVTRLRRFLALSALPSGKFRVPVVVSAAKTHRLGGSDGLNIQNLTSGRARGQSKTSRRAIQALQGPLTAPDSSQIEPRVMAYVAGNAPLNKAFLAGECPYATFASAAFDAPIADILEGHDRYKSGERTPENKEYYMYRQLGKVAVLELGYAAAPKGFYKSLHMQYPEITRKQSDWLHEAFRQHNPAYVDYWDTCKFVLDALLYGGEGGFGGPDGQLFYYTSEYDHFGERTPGILLPSGIWLLYPGLHKRKKKCGDEILDWDEHAYFPVALTPGQRYADPEKISYMHATGIWYGSLCNHTIQALAFAVLKWQGIRIARIEDASVAFNVHDEFPITALNGANLEPIAQRATDIMRSAPSWMPGLALECSYTIGDNYAET